MHDTLEFFQTQPDIRADHMGKLGFSMHYFYNERYILPLSHDEVVHGKATILQKMYGDYENKFPQARLFYLYMTAHPGKKLNFMGNEFGQLREWSEKREQDWMLFDYPKHQKFYQFMKELNIFYRKHPALYKEDYEGEGFQWDTNWTGSRRSEASFPLQFRRYRNRNQSSGAYGKKPETSYGHRLGKVRWNNS